MELHHLRSKAFPTAIQQLGDQTDLWGEHQAALTRRQRLGGGLEVHLGFTGTGNAPKQKCLCWRGLSNRRHGPNLGLGELPQGARGSAG